jgi:hypothetical protein
VKMSEKMVLVSGCLFGTGAGLLFYLTHSHLSYPALLYAIVDFFGVVPGAVFVGLISAPIGIGIIILVIEFCFPDRQESEIE